MGFSELALLSESILPEVQVPASAKSAISNFLSRELSFGLVVLEIAIEALNSRNFEKAQAMALALTTLAGHRFREDKEDALKLILVADFIAQKAIRKQKLPLKKEAARLRIFGEAGSLYRLLKV